MDNLESIILELKKRNARRIFVQYPEGLVTKILEISRKLEENGFDVVISMEPCYGACDIRDFEAERLGCDIILHIGHLDFGLKTKLPVVYWEYMMEVNPIPTLEKEFQKLEPYKKIGLLTSLQYVRAIEKVKEYLKKRGKEVFIHKTLKYPGQVLGCCVYSAEAIEEMVDCFLFVGSGLFHPLSVAMKVEKPVLSLDLEKNSILDLEEERKKWLKRKAWHESKLKDARRVGILVSWKIGQNRIEEALKFKDELLREGKEVFILVFDRIDLDKLDALKLDCHVNMACPRLDFDVL